MTVSGRFARSVLAQFPEELGARLREEGERADYPAGTTVYRAGANPQAALVVKGLLRVFLSSPEGRQVTVRYARPGDVLGIAVLVGGPRSRLRRAAPAGTAGGARLAAGTGGRGRVRP